MKNSLQASTISGFLAMRDREAESDAATLERRYTGICLIVLTGRRKISSILGKEVPPTFKPSGASPIEGGREELDGGQGM
jgi:hypothetical protein